MEGNNMTALTNPATGKTYTFKGLTPLSRITEQCQHDSHSDCKSSPQKMIEHFGFDFTKATCCLCECHFEGSN
jgi:hypothetical protein